MAYAAISERKGNSKELLAQYDNVSSQILALPRHSGHTEHICVELPDGIRVVNLFENEQQARSFFDRAEFKQIFQKAGMSVVEPTILRVHNHQTFG